MKALPQVIARVGHRLSWPAISLLMIPVLGWVWMAAKGPVISVFSGDLPRYVLSGRLFTEPFNRIHAGSALDQPTIGKWLLWFTVMAASSLPYVALLGWLADRRARSGRLAFDIGISVLGVFLLCILSGPMCLLVQYVCSMGFTPKRIYGLVYGTAGGLLVIGFVVWSLRSPGKKSAERIPCNGDEQAV
jgi:hypothetical protein